MKYSLPLSIPESKEFSALFNAVFAKILESVNNVVNLSVKYIPFAESFAIDTLDAMFAPKQILRQLFLILAIRIVLFGQNISGKLGYSIYCLVSKKGKQEKQLFDKLSNVKSYAEWKEVAFQLDMLKGFDKWRNAENSSLYDSKVVKRRIKDTLEMLNRGDVFDLMFRIRGGLARDQFGIQHEGLFTRALSGTKVLVESYHETVVKALNFICDSPIADEEVCLINFLF
jgi:TAG lipase/steryl ester hydrolase/phospholipase A2/LPA acyltransferase